MFFCFSKLVHIGTLVSICSLDLYNPQVEERIKWCVLKYTPQSKSPKCSYNHAQSRLWGTLLRRSLRFVHWCHTCNPVKERDPIAHGRIQSLNSSLQAIDQNQRCSKQAHSTGLVLVMGIKVRSLRRCTFTVLRVPF